MEELLNEYNNMNTYTMGADPIGEVDIFGTVSTTNTGSGLYQQIQSQYFQPYTSGQLIYGTAGIIPTQISIINHGNRYSISAEPFKEIGHFPFEMMVKALDDIYEKSNQSVTSVDIAYQISKKLLIHIEFNSFKNRNELQQVINRFLFDEFNKNGSKAKEKEFNANWLTETLRDLTRRQDINQPFYQILTGTTGMRAFQRAFQDYVMYGTSNPLITYTAGTINLSE